MATILSRPPSTYREAARPKLPLVVILGINGRQGTSVAKAFLGSRKYRIRGLTTRPDCFESNRWRAYGVEIREERFMEYSHVRESFKGADIIFAVSCFSTTDHRLDLAYDVGMISRSIDKLDLARKADSEKGIMVLDAAASTKGLRRFIMSTLPIVLTPGAKFATRRAQQHHESKSEQLLYLTSNVPELFHKTILVRAAACMEDFWLTLRLREDGSLTFGTTAPAELSLFWVHMSVDFGTYVYKLAGIGNGLFNFAAHSDLVSGQEICDLITQISGRRCNYRMYSVDEMAAQFQKDVVSELLPVPAGSRLYDEGVCDVITLNNTLKQFNTNVKRTTFKQYLEFALPQNMQKFQDAQRMKRGGPGVVMSSSEDMNSNGVLDHWEETLRGMRDERKTGPNRLLTDVLVGGTDPFMGNTAQEVVKKCMDTYLEIETPMQDPLLKLLETFALEKDDV